MSPLDKFNPLTSVPQFQVDPKSSPLLEQTCLVFPPAQLTSSPYPPYLNILDAIIRAEFTINNLQLIDISSQTAVDICSCVETNLKVSVW